MKFWQIPAGFGAKISFWHSFESGNYFSGKIKDANFLRIIPCVVKI